MLPPLDFQPLRPYPHGMEEASLSIKNRVAAILDAISGAARDCGRKPSDVSLMAVVKTRPPGEILALADTGIALIGENRIQEWETHRQALGEDFLQRCRVHFIGRLQSNKARRALLSFHSIDSVDRADLADRLARLADEEGIEREVMIEVNMGEESQKGGVLPGELPALVSHVLSLPSLQLTGLQGVSPYFDSAEASRPFFRLLARLFDQVRQAHPSPRTFRYLSMGMSHDFKVAVEEGATLVRIGEALFGPRRSQ
jgi:pyridoxal phosphate enzyme (YggS family)